MFTQTTHITLLERLGKENDPLAWREFCNRYGTLIRNFARNQGLQPADCDDVLQDVLIALTKAMPRFEYDPLRGKFRSYLKTMTLHAIFDRLRQKRGQVPLEDIETDSGPAAAAADVQFDQQWEAQWRQYHLNQAMRIAQAEFSESDLAAFQRYAVDGLGATETANMLAMSVERVYQAKSRILKRLSEIIDRQVQEEG